MPLTLDGDTGVSGNTGALTADTAKASTSGTNIDFTGIPSWVKRITVIFNDVSTNGTSRVQVQLGTSGGLQTSSYKSYSAYLENAASVFATSSTTGMVLYPNLAAGVRAGTMVIQNVSGNIWVSNHTIYDSSVPSVHPGAGNVTLSGALTQLRITTVNGTDAFDAGSINVLYE